MKNKFQNQTFKKFIYIQKKTIYKYIYINLYKIKKIHIYR